MYVTLSGISILVREEQLENGNIPVVEEDGEEERNRLLKLQYQQVNIIRKAKGLPELTEEQFLVFCRPNQITDESIVCLSRRI